MGKRRGKDGHNAKWQRRQYEMQVEDYSSRNQSASSQLGEVEEQIAYLKELSARSLRAISDIQERYVFTSGGFGQGLVDAMDSLVRRLNAIDEALRMIVERMNLLSEIDNDALMKVVSIIKRKGGHGL